MITLNREDFLQKLEAVQPGLTMREIIEQSSCFVFLEGEVVTYNEEVACRQKLDTPIRGAVQAAPLLELLRKLREDEIKIEQDGSDLLIAGKGRKAKLILQKEIVLPVEKIERPKKWKPLHPDFTEAVQIACEITSNSTDFRLIGLHITPKCIESIDGYQILRYRMKKGTGIETTCLVRKDSIKQIVPLGMHEISESESWMHFRNSVGLVVSCRRGIAEFPNVSPFLELQGEQTTLPKGLGEAAQRAEIFTREKKDENLVTVQLKPGKLVVKGEGNAGEYYESKKISYDGEAMEFMISPSFLVTLAEKHNECEICLDKHGHKYLKVEAGKYTYCTSLGMTEDKKNKDDQPQDKDED